ncbi:hypothetical protein AVEN_125000-1 [Araneus ventricosus]|uniref:Uncharacterized protein n=1 Tax=Araneus ventricosus TaxID=182803 RepID=A0A4Y2EC03_ARAVE|nr:hypothetical protein AVEN_125000-1 [Araneus ventricosus]
MANPTTYSIKNAIMYFFHVKVQFYWTSWATAFPVYVAGTALHYDTDTVSWHMRKPAPNFEQEWLKRVANNLVSRLKIRGIIKFISENRDLFLPP